jgi:hypothetical protein
MQYMELEYGTQTEGGDKENFPGRGAVADQLLIPPALILA